MSKDGKFIIDSDFHVMEPWDLWMRYLPERWRGQAPVGSRLPRDISLVPDLAPPWTRHDGAGHRCRTRSGGATHWHRTWRRRSVTTNSRLKETGARRSTLRPWTERVSMSV